MSTTVRRVGLMLLIVALSAGITRAEMMAYKFAGVVDWVDSIGSGWVLDDSIHVGIPFSGRFTFDSEAPDSEPSTSHGRYGGPGFSLSVDAGSYSWSAGHELAEAVVAIGSLSLDAGGFPVSDDLWVNQISCGLRDPSFASDALPIEPFPLPASNYFFVKVDNIPFSGESQFGGHLTDFIIVPEPTTVLFMALAFGLLLRHDMR